MLFPIPEDVAYELSRIDLDFEPCEIIQIYDLHNRPIGHYAGQKNFRVCKNCGHGGLEFTQTKHGWRLTYAYGELEGKIHACPSEVA